MRRILAQNRCLSAIRNRHNFSKAVLMIARISTAGASFFLQLLIIAIGSFTAWAEDDSPPKRPLSFVNDVVPILTKANCNTGACHAKAGSGQRGFELSLLGFEPQEDYEHIVKEAKGRRVFPPAPEQSLLVLKAANIVPHGGGKQLDPESESYQNLSAMDQRRPGLRT